MRRRPQSARSEGAKRPIRRVDYRAADKTHDPRERSERQQTWSCVAARSRPEAKERSDRVAGSTTGRPTRRMTRASEASANKPGHASPPAVGPKRRSEATESQGR